MSAEQTKPRFISTSLSLSDSHPPIHDYTFGKDHITPLSSSKPRIQMIHALALIAVHIILLPGNLYFARLVSSSHMGITSKQEDLACAHPSATTSTTTTTTITTTSRSSRRSSSAAITASWVETAIVPIRDRIRICSKITSISTVTFAFTAPA
ncbi:uncharacterized protein B0T23DRAFT_431014 [Neurospora hispaniola]|uniref:Uncharacterized protein n=1 Tax=Neurospora hispaniola TaxID=588809 RepID=A0AAJ0I4W6_9PEZI|nr:hypothetical protein B0T23DRAFT_431014 [Neurospora hispaniola]